MEYKKEGEDNTTDYDTISRWLPITMREIPR